MSEKEFGFKDIEKINKRIRRIKDYGFQPLTIKTVSDQIRNFIHPKGISIEGEIKSYSEYIMGEENPISREDYYSYLKDFFITQEYTSQTYLKEVKKSYADTLDHIIEEYTDLSESDKNRFHRLSDSEKSRLLQEWGEKANEEERRNYNSSAFYDYATQYAERWHQPKN